MAAIQIPQIVKDCSRWSMGAYGPTVTIDYNWFYVSVMKELQHTDAESFEQQIEQLRSLRRVRVIADDQDHPDLELADEMKRKIGQRMTDLFKDPEVAKKLVNRGKAVVQEHIDALKPFGTIVSVEADGFMFCPFPEKAEEIEGLHYYCPNLRKPYSASRDRSADYCVILGHDKYVLYARIEGLEYGRLVCRNVDQNLGQLIDRKIRIENTPLSVIDDLVKRGKLSEL